MPKRLTRKEITREDSIQQTLATTSSWVFRNQKLLMGGLLALILAILGAYQFQSYRSSADQRAQQKFSQALEIFHATTGDKNENAAASQPASAQSPESGGQIHFQSEEEKYQKSLTAFQEVADEFPGTQLGEWSLYYQALCHQALGQSEQANQTLEQLISKSGHPEVKNLARNALAQMLISQGQEEQAISQLSAILDEPSPNFPLQVVLMRLAASYETLGNTEKALEFYKRVTAEFPGSEFSFQANSRIQQLEPLQQ